MCKRYLSAISGAIFGGALLAGCATQTPNYGPGATVLYETTSCANRVVALTVKGRGGNEFVYALPGERALIFKAGMVIDADGAPTAFHPQNRPDALDTIDNAGDNGNWWSLATNKFGQPFVQGYNDPAPGFYVSKTELYNPQISDQSSTERYVDAQAFPYIALPSGQSARKAFSGAGVKLGDLVAVYSNRTGVTAFGIYADTSPSTLLGEASIKLADELGLADTSPKTGTITNNEFVYLIFPNTSEGWPRALSDVRDQAGALIARWGGRNRLAKCAAQL